MNFGETLGYLFVNDSKLIFFSINSLANSGCRLNCLSSFNDFSVINDWFAEKFDANDKDKNPIFNTNEIDNVIAKYGTQYVMKIGIVNYRSKTGIKRTYYYGFIYDIKDNDIVYKRYVVYRDKDSKDLINAKVYQTFHELKHSK